MHLVYRYEAADNVACYNWAHCGECLSYLPRLPMCEAPRLVIGKDALSTSLVRDSYYRSHFVMLLFPWQAGNLLCLTVDVRVIYNVHWSAQSASTAPSHVHWQAAGRHQLEVLDCFGCFTLFSHLLLVHNVRKALEHILVSDRLWRPAHNHGQLLYLCIP